MKRCYLDYQELRTKFEDLIRLGKILEVRNEIESLNTNQVPRPFLAAFADIARRVRSENWGLRLLRPIVRAEPPANPPPTEQELCVYAGLLIKAGSLPEAAKILDGLANQSDAQILTFQSQIHIAQWNYKRAAPELKKVISDSSVPPYQRCIAQVNLAGAYLFLKKYSDAQKLLPQILRDCQQNKWDLLYGNALELSAQLAVLEGRSEDAQTLLQEAQTHAGQHSHYSLLIEKWRCLDRLMRTPILDSALDPILQQIEALRSKANTLGSWETVRDLDYQIALHLGHQNLLLNVYFGTPHTAYKKRIEEIFKNRKWKIPEFYFRKLSESPATRVLDLTTGNEIDQTLSEPLKPGQMLHRFLNILAQDFYKPIGLGELFSKIFPNEYFNPDTASDRISQAVRQLRNWFQSQNVPLGISVKSHRYLLMAEGPYAFKMSRHTQRSEDLADSGFEIQLQKLKSKWPYQSFSASKAAQELNISTSGVHALFQRALEENRIYKSGSGRSTLYRFEK